MEHLPGKEKVTGSSPVGRLVRLAGVERPAFGGEVVRSIRTIGMVFLGHRGEVATRRPHNPENGCSNQSDAPGPKGPKKISNGP